MLSQQHCPLETVEFSFKEINLHLFLTFFKNQGNAEGAQLVEQLIRNQ